MMAHILVVDDVPVVRLVIGKILRRAGHEVLEAANGDDALALIRVRPPDAVVTDLWMPGSDGLGLIRVLKEGFPGIAVVAMSGGSPRDNQEKSLMQARESGVAAVLIKPVDKNDLVAAVGQALASIDLTKGLSVS
jgi:two-component system, chemotaxis family, chemotaxis protein CheY